MTSSSTTRLRWLEGLFPGYFALVMATGILSIAFDRMDWPLLSDFLLGVTLIAWIGLIILSCWRVIRFPHAVRVDLLSPRRVFAFFTLVAATSSVGILLSQHGYFQRALRLGLAADFPPLQWISRVMVWVAFATWCVTMVGLLHRLIAGTVTPRSDQKA